MTADTEALRIAELEEENERLRRLLDLRDAPGELRHRLRSTLALLRAIVRRSAETGRDLPGYAAQLEDRLDALVRAQAQADQHGEVDLRKLLADELFQYGVLEGERLVLSGPDVRLKPRAGQVLALALHELAVNAVEHGALGTGKSGVEVCWSVASGEPNTPVLLSWTEPAPTPAAHPGPQGFGTEVLTRMLPYELKAHTEFVLGTDGLRCSVRFALPDQVGRVLPEG